MKKKTIWLSLGALAVIGAGAGWFAYNTFHDDYGLEKNPTVQTNYFQTINYDWLQSTEIPSDKPAVSAVSQVSDNIEEVVEQDIEDLTSGKVKTDDKGLNSFITYYELATDFDQREKDGTKAFKKELDEILALKSFEDIFKYDNDDALPLIIEGNLPFSLNITADPNDSDKKLLGLNAPSIFLGDPSYYEKDQKAQLEPTMTSSMKNVLKAIGYSDKEVEKLVSQAMEFDEKLVKYQLSSEELSDVTNSFNILKVEETKDYSKQLDFQKFITDSVEGDVTQVNVVQTDYFKDFDKLITDDNFEIYKSWLVVTSALASSNHLTEEVRQAAGEFTLYMQGIEELMDKKEAARDLALAVFPESTSIYYGENHFGDEAREDVENMAKSIIAVYKDRISKNDWLGDATKEKAIKKLDNMGLNVGYQDKASDLEGELTVDENLTFFENSENISEYSLKYEYEHFSEPIDKSQWAMPSYEVNAYYNPMDNSINFPAAILEEPFYSKDQSEEANYGGIATVIGHEITHAFDDNGALFDEKGNMKNWWTDEDTKAFKERTSAMVDLFDGREIFGGKVNGKLTVTENTADAGGISASLEALKKEKEDADTKAFFETYATIWREKSSTMFGQLMLTLDPHSPTELRTNVQVANMDEFYDVYDVKEGNPMYIAPEDRVHIW